MEIRRNGGLKRRHHSRMRVGRSTLICHLNFKKVITETLVFYSLPIFKLNDGILLSQPLSYTSEMLLINVIINSNKLKEAS